MTFGEEQYEMIWYKKKKTKAYVKNDVGLLKSFANDCVSKT